jgi:hypothetical protein
VQLDVRLSGGDPDIRHDTAIRNGATDRGKFKNLPRRVKQ